MSMVTSLMRMAAPRSEVSAPVGNRRHASADRASYYMLQLYRTNLEVRLQCIDQETGAIQSDAALRQSIEPRQMAAATLSDGALLAIL
jgi:hypothetical protein